MSEPGTISAATSGKAAEDGSPGTTIGRGFSSGWPHERDAAAVLAIGSTRTLGAEMRQHALGVVARGFGSITVVLARRLQAGEQHRRLHLRRGDRQARRRSGSDRGALQRAAAAGRPRPLRRTRAPIRSSGSSTRRIGRLRKQASPSKVAAIWAAGDHAQHQPEPVPELPKSSGAAGLSQAADARRRGRASRRRRRAPAARRARAWRRRCSARPRLRAGPSTVVSPTGERRPGSGRGARSTCRPARGRGPAGPRAAGGERRQDGGGHCGRIPNNARPPTTRPAAPSSGPATAKPARRRY